MKWNPSRNQVDQEPKVKPINTGPKKVIKKKKQKQRKSRNNSLIYSDIVIDQCLHPSSEKLSPAAEETNIDTYTPDFTKKERETLEH